MRERIPHATYDDRLVTRRVAATAVGRVTAAGGRTTSVASSEATIDLLAHVLAAWIGTTRAVPYR